MSAPSDLLLIVDMQNRRLVSFTGLPPQFQSNTISLRVQCVNPGTTILPTGSGTSQSYILQNMAGFGMRAAVGPTPEGVTGPDILALQPAMTWDPTNQWFFGDLALNTSDIDSYIGTEPSATAYFELNLTVNGTRITILQTTFTLKAVVDELLSLVPTPTDSFLTAAESNAKFMPRIGAAGDVLTLVSPNGLIRIEIGVDNNGNKTENIIS